MKGASSLSLFKHRARNKGGDVDEDEKKQYRSSDNGSTDGRHRTRSSRGWMQTCTFQKGEWQNISRPITTLDGKTLTFWVKAYLHLHVLSATLQEVADTLHPLILNVVKTKHWSMCQAVEREQTMLSLQGRWGPRYDGHRVTEGKMIFCWEWLGL